MVNMFYIPNLSLQDKATKLENVCELPEKLGL